MANNKKGNVAGSNKPDEIAVNMTKPIVDGLDEINRKAHRVIVADAKKYITETANYAVKEIQAVSSQLDKMSKKGINITVDGNAKKLREEKSQIDINTEKLEKIVSEHKESIEKASAKSTMITKSGKQWEQTIANASSAVEEARKKFLNDASEENKSLVEKSLKALTDAENAKIPIAEKAMGKVIDFTMSMVKKTVDYAVQEFTRGVNDFVNNYNKTFSELAGKTGSAYNLGTGQYSRSGVNALYTDTRAQAMQSYGGALNVNSEIMPALQKMASTGLQGNELIASAITSAVDNKIMPWLDETSETWVTLSQTIGEQGINNYKNQLLALQNTTEGNRLLQSGVISKLTDDLLPVLQNIDYNTMDENKMSGDLQGLMTSLMKVNKYTEQQAYAEAQKMVQIKGNMYGALTSGDATKVMQASALAGGQDVIGAYYDTRSAILNMAQGTNDIGASAVLSNLGGLGFVQGEYATASGVKSATQSTSGGMTGEQYARKMAEEFNKASQTDEQYQNAKDNLSKFSTSTEVFKNAIENFGTTIADFIKSVPGNDFISGLVTSLPTALVTAIGSKATTTAIKKGISTLTEKGAIQVAGKSGAKSLLTGASGTAVGVAGIVAGLSMMGIDAYKGVKKSDDWGVSKGKAGLTSAVLGSGDAGLKKAGSQALKYGAIGAGIGTLVGGPLGTAIGGTVGLLGGALTGLVDTKKVAQWWQKKSNERKENKALEEQEKEKNKSEKGIVPYVKRIINLIENIISTLGGDPTAKPTKGDIKKATISTMALGNKASDPYQVLIDGNKIAKRENKTPEEKIVDAIFSVGSAVIEAMNKNDDIDYKNGLLSIKKNAVNNNMVNLYVGNSSTGSLV